MSVMCRILVLFLFMSEYLCKIDVTNLIDSIDYHKSNFEIEKKGRRAKVDKSKPRRTERFLNPKHNKKEATRTAISNIGEYEEISSEPDPIILDNLPVLEASKKYGLPKVIEKCVRKGDIALTFDDGVSKFTQEVLDILHRENAKATFFIIGNTLDSPVLGEDFARDVLNKMLKDGHVIASHSYSHPDFNNYWPEGIFHEMNRTGELFIKHTGKSPRFMRPPFGNVNPRAIQALHDLGYFIIRWNVDTNDWMHTESPEKSFQEFSSKLPDEAKINNIRWQKTGLTEFGVKTIINGILDSKIALMHDIHSGIAIFLPRLIQHARSLGYQLVTMDECLGGINPYFENSGIEP